MVAFTATLKRQARRLYDEGHGCNAIARQLDVTPSTISTWAKANGLKFDRSQTELAVRAHTIDLHAEAIIAAQEAMVLARDLAARVHRGNFTVHAFGGMDGAMHTGVLADAPPEAVVKATTALATAVDKALKITALQGDDRLAGNESLLDALATGFARAARDYTPPTA